MCCTAFPRSERAHLIVNGSLEYEEPENRSEVNNGGNGMARAMRSLRADAFFSVENLPSRIRGI